MNLSTGVTEDGRVQIAIVDPSIQTITIYLSPDRARWLAQDLILLAYRAEMAARKAAATAPETAQ